MDAGAALAGYMRTDAQEDEQDNEDLADGRDGEGEGGEDLPEGL